MRWIFLVPIVLLGVVLAGLGFGLSRSPDILPSALLDKPAPDFNLAPVLPDRPGFRTSDLRGMPAPVNVWASWCTPCRVEHPLLMKLTEEAVIFGINIRDQPEAAQRFLAELGNPYKGVGADPTGRTAIEWGVYGVPETFVIDAEGRIRYRHVGPLTDVVIADVIRPLLRRLQP